MVKEDMLLLFQIFWITKQSGGFNEVTNETILLLKAI